MVNSKGNHCQDRACESVAATARATGQSSSRIRQLVDRSRVRNGIAHEQGSAMSNMNRLETIAHGQRSSRVRDLAFAALFVLAGSMSVIGVEQAVRAASITHIAQR